MYFNLINTGINSLMRSVGASRKIFKYLSTMPKINLHPGYITSPRGSLLGEEGQKGEIEFRDVSFSYPTRPNTEVLHSISFTIKAGETAALVGPSGSGKSSIV